MCGHTCVVCDHLKNVRAQTLRTHVLKVFLHAHAHVRPRIAHVRVRTHLRNPSLGKYQLWNILPLPTNMQCVTYLQHWWLDSSCDSSSFWLGFVYIYFSDELLLDTLAEINLTSDSKKRLHICYCIQKQMCNRFYESDYNPFKNVFILNFSTFMYLVTLWLKTKM